MKRTKILMGMPITTEIVDCTNVDIFLEVFSYFEYIDNKFSTYKKTSEITQINSDRLQAKDYSLDMKKVFALAEKTKRETGGYFNVLQNAKIDPSGLVKGWAIANAAKMLIKRGYKNFYIEAGGDIQTNGKNQKGELWTVGIRDPFNPKQIIKVLYVNNKGIATSGTYERGLHIYNPKRKNQNINEIVSLTVIGPNIYDADRFATAAFAMGKKGINFIENLKGFEGYVIDKKGRATYTNSFGRYTLMQ